MNGALKRCSLLIIILSLAAISTTCCFAQLHTGLSRENGFKDITLGEIISNVKNAKLIKKSHKKNELSRELYEIKNGKYQQIGNVKIKKIVAEVYKKLIYEINVVTAYSEELIDALKQQYGMPSYDMRKNQYIWSSSDIALTFERHKRKIILTYTSLPLQQLMKKEKLKHLKSNEDNF